MLRHTEMEDCMEGSGTEYFLDTKDWIMGHSAPFRTAIDAFKFLPTFLLLAYIAFLVDRWRQFLVTCHSLQGKEMSD